MGCPNDPNCGKNKTPSAVASVSAEAELLSYSAVANFVNDRAGKPRRLDGLLLDQGSPPRGSWRANIPVKGHLESIGGLGGPQEAFRQAKELLSLNGIQVSNKDLWLNLNIQWLQRASRPEKHPVTLEALIAAAKGNPAPVVAHESRANIGPKQWGAKGWGILQVYLMQQVYEWNTFYRLASLLADLVNPDINPKTGCADCYRHYMLAFGRLRAEPLHDQNRARKWVVDTMNAVNRQNGKKELSYEEAAAINFWT